MKRSKEKKCKICGKGIFRKNGRTCGFKDCIIKYRLAYMKKYHQDYYKRVTLPLRKETQRIVKGINKEVKQQQQNGGKNEL